MAAEVSSVKASVVIPTFNRRESLLSTLASLAGQFFPADQFEVIVVDDGSTDGTSEIERDRYPFKLRILRQPNQGSAAARNAGALEARGRLLIFLDDDMIVEPNYVSGLAEDHRLHPMTVGMGALRPAREGKATLFESIHAVPENTLDAKPEGEFVSFVECVTNNLSVEKEDFLKIGMMQDVAGDGPTWWGDVDFGYRASRLGYRFRRCGRAVCRHDDYSTRDLTAASSRAFKAAQMAVALFGRHPELEPYIPMFREMAPIRWKIDPASLIVRKMARRPASSKPSLQVLRRAIRFFEKRCPWPLVLRPLYRWYLGGHIFQGFRDGLRERAESVQAVSR